MVAVRDQELDAREARRVVDPPEPVSAASEVGLAVGCSERLALVEQKDGLELCPCRPQQPQPAFLRAAVRAFVRQNDAPLVRLGAQRGDESGARALDAVGADVMLCQEPVSRFPVSGEYPGLAPGRDVPRGVRLVVR